MLFSTFCDVQLGNIAFYIHNHRTCKHQSIKLSLTKHSYKYLIVGCVDVDRSPFIYDEIKRAQENLVLTNDLHLLYLVTTPDMFNDIQPDWLTYLTQVMQVH